ncbi:MAG: hypothetical protein M3619_00565 [Myxococcota bacterium]|nr:hypothetical protein [Myxococcota bacterium]
MSLNDTMARFLYGVKQHLKANGYSVKGSSDGAAAAMDAVDRWTGPTVGTTTRGANAVSPQSWIVLTDANGVNILFAYMGSADHNARIAFSATGVYAAAATATHTPGAADDAVLTTVTTDLINITASGDRLWSCWVASDAKSFRVAVARAGIWVGGVWGVETFNPVPYAAGVVVLPNVWGLIFQVSSMTNTGISSAQPPTRGGLARTVVSSAARICTVGVGAEAFPSTGGAQAGIQIGQDIAPELQGGSEYPMKQMNLYSATVGSRGKLGNVIDFWMGRTTAGDGNVYGNGEFITIGSGGDIAWPWDGTPGVPGSTVVMA